MVAVLIKSYINNKHNCKYMLCKLLQIVNRYGLTLYCTKKCFTSITKCKTF